VTLASVALADSFSDFFFFAITYHDIERERIQSGSEHHPVREPWSH
jgi:hypothetical protein